MAEVSLSGIQARATRNRAHNRWVVQKLALFSLLMVVAPLATFFGVRAWIGAGVAYVDSWSGFAAVLMVNVVVGCYVASAWMEDDGGGGERVPPVGRFATAKAKQQ